MSLTGSINCVTGSAERCSETEGSFRCYGWTHAHVQTRAPAPGFSGTMSLSQSPMLPTAVVRRRLLKHGWPALLQCLSTRLCRDLLNLTHTYIHRDIRSLLGRQSMWWLDINTMGRDSLHYYYVDSVHRDQDDGLPPETCTKRQRHRFINTRFITTTNQSDIRKTETVAH